MTEQRPEEHFAIGNDVDAHTGDLRPRLVRRNGQWFARVAYLPLEPGVPPIHAEVPLNEWLSLVARVYRLDV